MEAAARATLNAAYHLCSLIACDETMLQGGDLETVAGMAAQQANAIAAGSQDLISGYWKSAVHQLREIVESGQLAGFFFHNNDALSRWAKAEGSDRHKEFAFSKINDALRKYEPALASYWRGYFGLSSNAGSHPSINGIYWTATPAGRFVGPTFNPNNFLFLSLDTALVAATATLQLSRLQRRLQRRSEPVSTDDDYFWRSVLRGAIYLLGATKPDELLAYLKRKNETDRPN